MDARPQEVEASSRRSRTQLVKMEFHLATAPLLRKPLSGMRSFGCAIPFAVRVVCHRMRGADEHGTPKTIFVREKHPVEGVNSQGLGVSLSLSL